MSFARYFFFLTIFFIPGFTVPQSYFFNHYELQDGLSDLNIHSVIQDNYGFLWIGTSGGLIRFDGIQFKELEYHHDTEDDAVYDLMIDDQDILWIAGRQGITSYDGSSFKYYGLPSIDNMSFCYGLTGNAKGEILFLHGDKQMYSLTGGEMIDISAQLERIAGTILKATRGRNSELMILTSEDEAWWFDHYEFKKIVHPGIDQGRLILASDGQLYSVYEHNLFLFNPLEEQYFKLESVLIDNAFMTDILQSESGSYWISYEDKTVFIEDNQVIELNPANGFDGGKVNRILQDKEHTIWLVTQDNGLYSYPGDVLTYLGRNEDRSFAPSSFLIDGEGKLHISYFGKGIEVYDGHGTYTVDQESGLASNYVRALLESNDTCWVITARGVTAMYNGRYLTYSTDNGLPHNYCFYGVSDVAGRIWVGTEGGVGIIDGQKIHVITEEDGLLNNRIKFLIEGPDNAMLLLSDHSVDIYKEGQISRFIQEGLNNKEVLNTMTFDPNGNIWLGSDINGLIFYKPGLDQIQYINQRMNLPFSRVRSLMFDKKERLVVGTERGIYYLEVTANGDIQTILSAGIEQGYPDFEVSQNAVLQDKNGIYFGTSIGAVKFFPDRIISAQEIPVHITGLKIEFRETDWTRSKKKLNTWFGVPFNPVLNHDQNDLQINFQGVSLKSRESLWYRYQLENYDQDWSDAIRSESVLYANLSPGKYRFKVSASSDGINWPGSFTQYDFMIIPPFWRTWWFYAIIFVSLLIGFAMINNYRIKARINQLLLIERLNKEEYEKIQKKVAMDFHDEIGNHLTSISMLVELIRQGNWKLPEDLQKLLGKIDEESKNLFLGTKDFTWSIDPKNNNLKEVFYKIKDYGEEIFDNTDIQFRVKNGVSQDININLPAGFTRQIVLIFKEALNNVRKHAGCKKVQFSMQSYADSFLIKLSDDGVGFNTGELEYYNGLKKMKVRGEKINGEVIFNSDPRTGTEIILKASLDKNIASQRTI